MEAQWLLKAGGCLITGVNQTKNVWKYFLLGLLLNTGDSKLRFDRNYVVFSLNQYKGYHHSTFIKILVR